MDSTKIVDSIISPHQRELMQLIFDGDSAHRDKVNLIIANEISPHLTAEEYMDKGQYVVCFGAFSSEHSPHAAY